MHPYRVSDEVFKRGYAEEGEYELVQGISLRSARLSARALPWFRAGSQKI
jgi:hypothetical protein